MHHTNVVKRKREDKKNNKEEGSPEALQRKAYT